jgi:hypothetical protein
MVAVREKTAGEAAEGVIGWWCGCRQHLYITSYAAAAAAAAQMKRLVSMKSGGSSPDMLGKTIIMVSSCYRGSKAGSSI